jgi:uncharacterized membrane protein YbhN (UPF0104 family)
MQTLNIDKYIYLVCCFLLMVINWGLEIFKWKLLVQSIQKLSWLNSAKSVLAGLASGLLTPNRIGNFVGRLAFIDKTNQNKALINTLVGNLAQFLSTLLVGLIGFLILIQLQLQLINQGLVITLSLLLVVVALSLYFKPSIVVGKFTRFFITDKTKQSINEVEAMPNKFKLNILFISTLRYSVFCVQYYVLFLAFNIQVSPLELFSLIATTFLITTLIPSLFFGKLFVRESTAVFIFSLAAIDITVVLVIAFLLWFINLAIPAIFGSYFWLKQKHV